MIKTESWLETGRGQVYGTWRRLQSRARWDWALNNIFRSGKPARQFYAVGRCLIATDSPGAMQVPGMEVADGIPRGRRAQTFP